MPEQKYLNPMKPPDSFGPGTPSCSREAVLANGGALAFDEWSYAIHPIFACWRVTGIPTPITPYGDTLMQALERFNVNIRSEGSQRTVPTQLALEGFVLGTTG